MSSFLSHLHADLRRALLTRRGATQHPAQVPISQHKEYVRMERITLPVPKRLQYALDDALARRRSMPCTELGAPLELADMSTLLGHALRRHTDDMRRNYPSGGALYPIETYVVAAHTSGYATGVFHYHPTAHALERMWALPADFDMRRLASKPDNLNPSALIVFTSVWERSSAKYGDLSYLHALLEAGHMSENILLTATAIDLETRPYAGFNDEVLSELLDLNEELEQPVHTILLSKPSDTSEGIR